MSKGVYVGVSSKARRVKKIYIGVGGKARKVKKGYIGVGGKARLFFSGSAEKGFYRFFSTDYNTNASKRRSILQRLDLSTYAQKSEINALWTTRGSPSMIGYYDGLFYLFKEDPAGTYEPRIMDPYTCADLGASIINKDQSPWDTTASKDRVIANPLRSGNRITFRAYAGSPLALVNSTNYFLQYHYTTWGLDGGSAINTFFYVGRASSSSTKYVYEIESATGTSIRGSWNTDRTGQMKLVATSNEIYMGFYLNCERYNRSTLARIETLTFVDPSKRSEYGLSNSNPVQIIVNE